MAVSYTKFREDSTTYPTNETASHSFGENIPSGNLESIIIRQTTTVATGGVLADYGNVYSSIRLTLNGEVLFDFRQAVNGGSNNNPSALGYFLNKIGGVATERPSDLTKEAYFVIPVGVSVPSGVGRIECQIEYAGTATASTAGSFQLWGRYNDAIQTTTRVVPATSFQASNALEQVVVRIPQNMAGYTVAGVLIQNDSSEDQLGSQGVRIMSQSQYGLDPDFIRLFSGDLQNGILYADDDLSTTQQSYAFEVKGALFIPCYNLAGGDLILQVDSSASTVRTFTPVMVAGFGSKQTDSVRQTARVSANTSTAILDKTVQ